MRRAWRVDGRRLAVIDLGGGINLFELPSGKRLADLKGHMMGAPGVAFFPDGKTLVKGGWDGKVKLWNLATSQEILTLALPLGCAFRSFVRRAWRT